MVVVVVMVLVLVMCHCSPKRLFFLFLSQQMSNKRAGAPKGGIFCCMHLCASVNTL